MTDTEFANWPDCAIDGCPNKCCLALDSVFCFPHTPGNEHVKHMKIDAVNFAGSWEGVEALERAGDQLGSGDAMLDGAVKKLEAHIWEREVNEHYVEPAWCSRRLFQDEGFDGSVYDPCCGFGTIVIEALKHGISAYGSDLVDRGWDSTRTPHDFLAPSVERHQNVVCNPPFNIAQAFAAAALARAERKVAMIFPTARLNAAHWLRGTPLRRIWLMTPRPSMPPGHTITAGEKPGGGKMDFCWLLWEQGFQGEAAVNWLRRDGPPVSNGHHQTPEGERP